MMKHVAGSTIYLQEELSNARLHCDVLKRMMVRTLDLINASEKKEHFYAVAGDIIYDAPKTLMELEQSLNSAALTLDKVDYEELRQVLKPEKVDELEKSLEDLRIRLPRRRG